MYAIMKKNDLLLLLTAGVVLTATLFTVSSCKKNKDEPLPAIGGYNNSNEVGAANLVGYWNFEGNGNEQKTGTAPTSSVGASYAADSVKGQALTLTNGYLYYASALAPLTTKQAFTVSAWVKVKNTGSAPTGPQNVPYSYFQSAIPGQLFGNITAMVEAGQYSYLSDTMVVKSIYKDTAGGTQDNINNYGNATDYKVVKSANKWANIVTTYTPSGGTGNQNIFRIYVNGVLVSNMGFETRGAPFKYTPGEVIIGGWYNNIPGKTVSTDTWTVPFNGKIDEIRVWNKLLPESDIQAIYNLGVAHR
jgi:hypothetical protein